MLNKKEIFIKTDTSKAYQKICGFGASACWWSQNIADEKTREAIAKLLYSEEGLGLNIYRYNVGGGVNPEHNRVNLPWRNTESFYFFNEKTGKWEYDFTRDKNAYEFMKESLKYGCIDNVILFANSPHYSMTISGEASGSMSGDYKTNLSCERYRDFVNYFLDITEHFIGDGIPVGYISPINEPQWKWGGEVRQEGCHYEIDDVIEIFSLFAEEIEKRKLNVKLSVPESGDISDLTKEYFTRLYKNEKIRRNLGSLAYHCYWHDDKSETKKEFGDWYAQQEFSSVPFEMTEWCELPNKHGQTLAKASAIMARVMANDMAMTKVNSWTSWVAVNTTSVGEDGNDYSDGMLSANEDFSVWSVGKRYYAMAHFSKFVPKGSVLIEATASPLEYKNGENGGSYAKTNLCAFKTPEGKTVIVISNEDKETKAFIDCDADKMTVCTTDSTHELEITYSGEKKPYVVLSENSVTTVIYE